MVNRIAPRAVVVSVTLASSLHAGAVFSQVTGADVNSSGVEEVTVTARKRPESSHDVDISLSVISADAIKSLRLRNLPEVAAYTPNVALFEDFPGAGIPAWFIRGVGLQDFNSNNTPAAGVYVDGNYQVATVMGMTALYDISQVEVLKGPQGGLYGRNTSGGAVLVNSNRAAIGQREASMQVGYGSWDQALAEGMINLPLGETVAWRMAGRVENSSGGWQKVIGSDDEHGDKDRWDLRSWLSWDTGGALSAQWKLQGGSDDSEIALGRSIGFYDPASPTNPCAAMLQGNRDDDNCINWGGSNRIFRNQQKPERLSEQAYDGSLVFSDPINRQRNDYVSSVLDLRWALSGMELVSISTYDNYDYGVDLDLDGSRGEYGHRLSTSDIEVWSQEFRLQSAGEGALQWMLGVVWSDEQFIERRDFNLRDNAIVIRARQLQPGLGKLLYDQDTTARSVYGDLAYALSERWSLNAALRYTDEEKEYRNGNFYILSDPLNYIVRNAARNYSLDEPWSGSVSLNFSPQENLFLYTKVSQGFKSGGFYGGFPLSTLEVTSYKEETIAAWEAGYKQAWPEQSLNLAAAVFVYDYRDVQGFVNYINPITGTAINILANQGDARHKGIEIDFGWEPGELFSLNAGLGWLNAEYRGGPVFTMNLLRQQVPVKGVRPYAPEWSGNLHGKYLQRVSNDKTLEWVLGYNYRSEFAGSQPSLVDAAVNKLPGYGVFDFSATLKRDTGPWDVTFWVKNLMDKTYRTRTKADGVNSYVEFFGEPRSIGVTALLRFSDWR